MTGPNNAWPATGTAVPRPPNVSGRCFCDWSEIAASPISYSLARSSPAILRWSPAISISSLMRWKVEEFSSPFSSQIGAVLASLDGGQLLYRRERVLGLIEASDWKWSRGIGVISGRLGVDTARLIARHLSDPATEETAILAACTADEAVGRQLVPSLLAYLNTLPISNDIPREAPRYAVKALARFGNFEQAKEIFLARYPKYGKRSLPVRSASRGCEGRQGVLLRLAVSMRSDVSGANDLEDGLCLRQWPKLPV